MPNCPSDQFMVGLGVDRHAIVCQMIYRYKNSQLIILSFIYIQSDPRDKQCS